MKGRQGTIRTPREFYEYCQNNLQKGIDRNTEKCVHKKRVFFFAERIDRPETKLLKTLAGTQSIHSAKGTSELGHVEMREFSCFCQHCQNRHSYFGSVTIQLNVNRELCCQELPPPGSI